MGRKSRHAANEEKEFEDDNCPDATSHRSRKSILDEKYDDEQYVPDENIDYDEYYHLHPEDVWFGRPFIGDEVWRIHMRNPLEVLRPRIATFYDTDGESEDFDLSDVEEEDDTDENIVESNKSYELFKGCKTRFTPTRMSDSAYRRMCDRMISRNTYAAEW